MKFLTTLNSEAHPSFIDITEEEINRVLEEDFGLHIEDLTEIKDIINTYSYMLVGEKGYYKNIELDLPYGMDLINSAITICVKQNGIATVNNYINVDTNIKEIELHHNIKTLLSIKLTGKRYKNVVRKMKSIDDIIQLKMDEFISPDFDEKLKKKDFNISYEETTKTKVGYLYIDYSASMVKFRKFINILKDNLIFKKIKIYIKVVVKNSIIDFGIVETKKDFDFILSKMSNKYVAGRINVENVIQHAKKHAHTSTFITDAEDFDINILGKNIKNFNLLKIDKDGRIEKITT